jgi:hypothetical protein
MSTPAISPNVLDHFTSLPDEEKRTALGRMSDETKQALLGAIQTRNKANPTPENNFGMIPGEKMQPTQFDQPKPTAVGRVMNKVAPVVTEDAPAILGMTGATVGTALAGPPGGIGGAIIGGAAGKAIQQNADNKPRTVGQTFKEQIGAGAVQGATEGAGQAIAPILTRGIKAGAQGARTIAPKIMSKADEMMANLIGASKPKYTGTAGDLVAEARNIGKVVNGAIDGGVTLDTITSNIGKAKEGLNQANEALLQQANNAGSVDIGHLVTKNGVNSLTASSYDPTQNAIESAVRQIEQQYGTNQIPVSKALELRRMLLKNTDAAGNRLWSSSSEGFRTSLYHDLNDAIAANMSPADAAAFRDNNYKIATLIKAQEAAQAKRLTNMASSGLEGFKSNKGLVDKATAILPFNTAQGMATAGVKGAGKLAGNITGAEVPSAILSRIAGPAVNPAVRQAPQLITTAGRTRIAPNVADALRMLESQHSPDGAQPPGPIDTQ